MRFLCSVLRQENVDQIQGKGYKFELRKFEGCKLHIEGYDSETPPVHNPKKHSGVVSEPETK